MTIIEPYLKEIQADWTQNYETSDLNSSIWVQDWTLHGTCVTDQGEYFAQGTIFTGQYDYAFLKVSPQLEYKLNLENKI